MTRQTLELAFDRAQSRIVIAMDEKALYEALRLAADPPSEVNIEALRSLVCDDDSPAWSISTVADHLQVSEHTLRYYERIGLITVQRDHAGYRIYDAAPIRRLMFLIRMRTSGMPIANLLQYIQLLEANPASVPDRIAF